MINKINFIIQRKCALGKETMSITKNTTKILHKKIKQKNNTKKNILH